MEETERIQERLENIKAIEPILSALRTVAGATWRAALSRIERLQRYVEQLEEVLAIVAPHVRPDDARSGREAERRAEEALLVIAAERGLCGGFNRAILTAAEDHIAAERSKGRAPQLVAWGEQARRRFDRLEAPMLRSEHLPVTSLLPFAEAQDMAYWALDAYEKGVIGSLKVMYNQYLSAVAYRPTIRQVLPAQPNVRDEAALVWPPAIIDTDPDEIHATALKHYVAAQLYAAIVESAAGEQAARFQTLDRSSQNAQRLIEELSLSFHQARQESITQEMLDLAAGAGLLAQERQEEHYHG